MRKIEAVCEILQDVFFPVKYVLKALTLGKWTSNEGSLEIIKGVVLKGYYVYMQARNNFKFTTPR